MSALFDPQFLAKLEKIHFISRGRVRGMQAGERRSNQLGSSLEFADYRTYFPGDDFRLIDWHAYARLGKWFLKTYLDERKTDFHFYIDVSQSMDHPKMSKRKIAIQLAAALGYMALVRGERVSVYSFRKQIERTLSSLQGRKSISRLFHFLEGIHFIGEGDFNQALTDPKAIPKQGGACFVITDAFFPSGMDKGFSHLQGAAGQVFLFHVTAKMERDPSYQGDLRLIDCESQETKEISMTKALWKEYRDTAQQFIRTLAENCYRRGITYVSIPVEEPFEQILFVRLRRLGIIR